MGEVQRYTLCKESDFGPRIERDVNGDLVLFDDHAAKVAELERAVKRMAKLYAAGIKVDEAKNAMDEANDGWNDATLKKAWLVTLDEHDEAIMLAMDNPIAREAIEKARTDAQSNH